MRVGIPRLRYVAVLSACHSPWRYHDLQSPLSVSPPSDFRFPSPFSDHALDLGFPRVQGNSVREKDPLPRYSSMFRMGLLFTVREPRLGLSLFNPFSLTQRAARHVDRAVQNVGDTFRKAKTTRGVEWKYAFDR
jgi:hypothetical protein